MTRLIARDLCRYSQGMNREHQTEKAQYVPPLGAPRSCGYSKMALVLMATIFLTGCFTMRDQYAAAWGGSSSRADRNKALAADIATAPIQAPILVPVLAAGAVASARSKEHAPKAGERSVQTNEHKPPSLPSSP